MYCREHELSLPPKAKKYGVYVGGGEHLREVERETNASDEELPKYIITLAQGIWKARLNGMLTKHVETGL